MEKTISYSIIASEYVHPYQVDLLAEGIVLVTMCEEEIEQVNLEHLKALRDCIGRLGGGKKMKVLMNIKTFSIISAEARRFSAEEEGLKYTLVNAIVVNSMAIRIGANFYIRFNKPVRPVKIFNKVESALEWLRSFPER